jgi:hypothetical protein
MVWQFIRPLGRLNDDAHDKSHAFAVYLPDLTAGN